MRCWWVDGTTPVLLLHCTAVLLYAVGSWIVGG